MNFSRPQIWLSMPPGIRCISSTDQWPLWLPQRGICGSVFMESRRKTRMSRGLRRHTKPNKDLRAVVSARKTKRNSGLDACGLKSVPLAFLSSEGVRTQEVVSWGWLLLMVLCQCDVKRQRERAFYNSGVLFSSQYSQESVLPTSPPMMFLG